MVNELSEWWKPGSVLVLGTRFVIRILHSSVSFWFQIIECVTRCGLNNGVHLISHNRKSRRGVQMIWQLGSLRALFQLLCDSLGFALMVSRWLLLEHQVLHPIVTISKDSKRGESAPKAFPNQCQCPLMFLTRVGPMCPTLSQSLSRSQHGSDQL